MIILLEKTVGRNKCDSNFFLCNTLTFFFYNWHLSCWASKLYILILGFALDCYKYLIWLLICCKNIFEKIFVFSQNISDIFLKKIVRKSFFLSFEKYISVQKMYALQIQIEKYLFWKKKKKRKKKKLIIKKNVVKISWWTQWSGS